MLTNEELNNLCLEKLQSITSENRKAVDELIVEFGLERVEYVTRNNILKLKYEGVSTDASEN